MAPSRALALLLAALASAPSADAASLRWSKRLFRCEPPSVFYSAAHIPGLRPCCATEVGLCAGGAACPPSGACPDGVACVPGTQPTRPNIVLFISDDQGECAWGSAGECRSVQSGTPIPPPSTPNLDLLSGYGTVFTVAHNTAAWCFPSLTTILTGRYQRSFGGVQRVAEQFATIPRALRSLSGAPGTHPDPYNPPSAVGGYCTFLGGKFAPAVGDAGFDALANGRKLGRAACTYDAGTGKPLCGSRQQPSYSPTTVFNQSDLFQFLERMIHPLPDAPGQFRMTPFFLWYAPRIPHAPLNAPSAIDFYLFGSGKPGLGGLFDLGQYCSGGSCARTVQAFSEVNIGSQADYWSSIWWTDDALREIREYVGRAGAPHCIGLDGLGRYDVTSPAQCPGTWATSISPDLERNTVYLYLSDNGWFLPNSKHAFTENGYRTRILVYDPRDLPTLPPSTADDAVVPPARNTDALAHSSDILPTIVGYALGTVGPQSCPIGQHDGKPCDGRDLRPFVYDANGNTAQPAGELRHALCGHETHKGVAPTNVRYLLTGAGSVGRCTDLTGAACSTAADCGAGQTCLGGHCTASVSQSCATTAQCPAGAACLGGRCVGGPSCIDDAACGEILGPGSWACVEADQKWCRNAQDVRCTTRDDCPVCAPGPGGAPAPCSRVCEPRRLKLYLSPAVVTGALPSPKLTDLFIDPDENGIERGRSGSLVYDLSKKNGPYQGTMARLSCCSDEWWPEVAASGGTICTGACDPKFSCTQ
jgi:hypothetical protein